MKSLIEFAKWKRYFGKTQTLISSKQQILKIDLKFFKKQQTEMWSLKILAKICRRAQILRFDFGNDEPPSWSTTSSNFSSSNRSNHKNYKIITKKIEQNWTNPRNLGKHREKIKREKWERNEQNADLKF